MWIQYYNTNYEISPFGEVRNMKTKKMLTPDKHMKGYLRVNISGKWKFIHRLVGELFVPNPDNKPQTHHIDGNKTNNNKENLQWVTDKENNQNVNRSFKYGMDHPNCKLTDEQVIYIRESGLKASILAKQFNVSTILIYKILNKQQRKYVK